MVICSLCLKIKANSPSFPYLKLCPHPAGKDDSVSGYFVHCTQAPADPASATSAPPTQHLAPSEILTASAPAGTAKSILGHGLPQPGCASTAAVRDMGQLAAPALKAEFAQTPISSSVTLQRALPQVQNY